MALLEASDLSVRFHTDDGPIHAVDGVSFLLERREVLAASAGARSPSSSRSR
jgi:ABC-type dipeptide/oligopeptide/nickel transport system ATPase component